MDKFNSYYYHKYGLSCCLCDKQFCLIEDNIDYNIYKCKKCNVLYYFYENSAFGIIDSKSKINIYLWLYENRRAITFNYIEKILPEKYSQEEFINAYIKYKGNLIFE